jgi:hypothetical protein
MNSFNSNVRNVTYSLQISHTLLFKKVTKSKVLRHYQKTEAECSNIGPQNGCKSEGGLFPFVCGPVVIPTLPLLLLCPKRT